MNARISIAITERVISAEITSEDRPQRNTKIEMEFEHGTPSDPLGLTQALTAVSREAARQLAA